MQARRTARELALLSIGQLPTTKERLETQQLQNVLLAAVRTLTSEVQEALEMASAELERGSDHLLRSETRAVDLNSSRAMVSDAVELTKTAINRLGAALEMPELIQMANQQDVRSYVIELLSAVRANQAAVDQLITQAMVEWKLHRLARIDQDILRIAVSEIMYLGIPDRVAINEAVELAKRYSGDDGHRFINGVLRRVSDLLQKNAIANPDQVV